MKRFEWVIRAAPPYIRPHSDKVMYFSYAWLIKHHNRNRRPKRTK